ncbi:MAG TPA: transcriptional regulator, partial [Pyrinomonadaceae bacterium]|nr:transcriptional regulator [Pyrinomonadaceae bacterium]
MKNLSSKIYSFGMFQLNASERLLFDGVKTIPMSPKVFDTLKMLVENSGRVLSKEKMMTEIWEDSFVEENNLAQNISILRRILGETKNVKFIETVPKYGYRFIAPVS